MKKNWANYQDEATIKPQLNVNVTRVNQLNLNQLNESSIRIDLMS